jgi:hypothetical protein
VVECQLSKYKARIHTSIPSKENNKKPQRMSLHIVKENNQEEIILVNICSVNASTLNFIKRNLLEINA